MDATISQPKAISAIHYRGWIIEVDFIYTNADGTPSGKYDVLYFREGDEQARPLSYVTLDDVKDAIYESIIMDRPQHLVVMNRREYYFDWIEDAIKFAVLWNAEEFHPA